jgi:hypothetical protein
MSHISSACCAVTMGHLDSTPKEVMSERRSIETGFGGKKGPLSEEAKEGERKLTAVG